MVFNRGNGSKEPPIFTIFGYISSRLWHFPYDLLEFFYQPCLKSLFEYFSFPLLAFTKPNSTALKIPYQLKTEWNRIGQDIQHRHVVTGLFIGCDSYVNTDDTVTH